MSQARQDKISAVIDQLGQEVVLVTAGTPTYDEDNGWTTVAGVSTTIIIIPWNYFSGLINYQYNGNMDAGSVAFITKGDVTIKDTDTFTYNSKNFIVNSVNPLPLEGVDLGIVIQASEQVL